MQTCCDAFVLKLFHSSTLNGNRNKWKLFLQSWFGKTSLNRLLKWLSVVISLCFVSDSKWQSAGSRNPKLNQLTSTSVRLVASIDVDGRTSRRDRNSEEDDKKTFKMDRKKWKRTKKYECTNKNFRRWRENKLKRRKIIWEMLVVREVGEKLIQIKIIIREFKMIEITDLDHWAEVTEEIQI